MAKLGIANLRRSKERLEDVIAELNEVLEQLQSFKHSDQEGSTSAGGPPWIREIAEERDTLIALTDILEDAIANRNYD